MSVTLTFLPVCSPVYTSDSEGSPTFLVRRLDVLGMVVLCLAELVQRFREACGAEGLPRGQRLPCQDRLPLLESGPLVPVDDAEGDAVAPFERLAERRDAVSGIVLRPEPVDPLAVPLVGVHLVEGDAGLQDVHEAEALVPDRLLHYPLQVLRIAGKGPGREAAVQRHGE